MPESQSQSQHFDVVVYGATSFVGQILTRYMWNEYGNSGKVSWAIAGRSKQKLRDLQIKLGGDALELPVMVADAADKAALKEMCEQTKVVISTVGPYALYGEPLVEVCCELGTDYVDLTGEPQWIRAMLDKYEDSARQSGARIVNCCGFDSIPSDLGVYHLQQYALQSEGEPCQHVRMRVKAIRGGASGGTVASLMNVAKQAAEDKNLRRLLANPYALCPADHGFATYQENLKKAKFEDITGRWIAPFVMAAINTRIVHRTNALLEKEYGERFQYDEAMFTGKDMQGAARGWMMSLGLGAFMLGAALPPTRWLLENYIMPKPGEGPSESQQEKGFYDLRFYGTTQKGKLLKAKVTGDRDPGYGSTAKMLAESALCLAQDIAKDQVKGGFWTPASVFGETLITRLQDKAGLTFDILHD
ncbi:saccharopine dehydrogenase family protein [Aestuariibacter salexigens]|uniref:saccharopine dehydrogenase family protein n=1 Tax=Aestuariibacter salexigens TaxID=226010 RepID=UPI0004208EC6|nr:saccharopine dehydrogenase NADP-binding domain-containing protein [Aestuariibacter salexigens]